MEASEKVFDLCVSEEDKSMELEAFMEKHPDVDVNLYQHANDTRSIHAAAYGARGACLHAY
jgi:hypothetical protein